MGETQVLWLLTIAALALASWRAWPIFRAIARARPAQRRDRPVERLAGTLAAIGLHRRLLHKPVSGLAHLSMMLGFLVLSTAILQTFGSRLFPGFSLGPIGGYSWIALLQDIFALLVIASVAAFAWQRLVGQRDRFRGSNLQDALVIYGLLVAIVATMLLEYASAIVAGTDPGAAWRPVSRGLAALLVLAGLRADAATDTTAIFYWLHVLAILAFLIHLPKSKHRHIFLAAPAIWLRALNGKGQLPPPPPRADTPGAPGAGVRTAADVTVKDALDTLACTECGRCQAVCPAYAAGLPLSPKLLIMDLRDALLGSGDEQIAGVAIRADTLWACTTCAACMEVCPVHIEHVPKIIDLRRALVDDGLLEPTLQAALTNLAQTGNAMGKPAKMRARWTKALPFRIKDARKEPVDVLWFVGDTASFDPRVEIITAKVANVLHDAGVDFGILYDGECNSGNDVRRVGEEGLFNVLAQQNIELLRACDFRRIMTTDPHSLNALRQEYRMFGAEWDVLHYTRLINELLVEGRLAPAIGAAQRVTYHDPCFLGRYNDEFEAPRSLIRATGASLVEMGRCRENSFCCGAGGGRIWMDDSASVERPSENRIREAMALGGIDAFVVACPKDTVMYRAAVQNLGLEGSLKVLDVIDLVRPG